jgi:hypothetical protein
VRLGRRSRSSASGPTWRHAASGDDERDEALAAELKEQVDQAVRPSRRPPTGRRTRPSTTSTAPTIRTCTNSAPSSWPTCASTAARRPTMAKLTMVQAINLALLQEMERDKSVAGADGRGHRAGRRRLPRDRRPAGEVRQGARAGHAAGRERHPRHGSIGMAMAGLRPVCEMQFCGFSYLMMGQYEAHATRMRARTHGQFTLPLVVRMPYGGGVRALEHHSESREVPGPTCRAPRWCCRAGRGTRGRCWRRPSATRTRSCSWSPSTRTAPSGGGARRARGAAHRQGPGGAGGHRRDAGLVGRHDAPDAEGGEPRWPRSAAPVIELIDLLTISPHRHRDDLQFGAAHGAPAPSSRRPR